MLCFNAHLQNLCSNRAHRATEEKQEQPLCASLGSAYFWV